MNDILCNLEDVSILLNSSVDNLLILHGEMVPGSLNMVKAHNAMYGVCVQLEEIATALRVCVDALEFGENQA